MRSWPVAERSAHARRLYSGGRTALKRSYDGEGRLLGLYEKCVTGRW